MTKQNKNRVVEFLLAGMGFLLVMSWMLQATPLHYTLLGLPMLLAVYVLLYGVEHSLRAVAAWSMSWAEGIAHRKKVGGKWEERLRRKGRMVMGVSVAGVAGVAGDMEVEVAKAV